LKCWLYQTLDKYNGNFSKTGTIPGAKYIEDDSIKQPLQQMIPSQNNWKSNFQSRIFNKIVETVAFVIDGLKKPILSKQLLKKFKLIHEDFPFAQVNHVKH